MSDTGTGTAAGRDRGLNRDTGKRIMVAFGFLMELVMIAVGLWPAVWLVLHYAPGIHGTLGWVVLILAAILVFNYGYLAALLVFRLIIPYPSEGLHQIGPQGQVPPAMLIFMLNVLLLKARYDPPWAAMFSSVLTVIPPFGPLFRRYFGPRTTSATLGDTVRFYDPPLIEAGRNVQFGHDCWFTAHHFDNRGMYIAKITIGDHAVIGGGALIMAGVEIGHHAVVGVRSLVMPNTKIAPYEYWAGTPAKKIKDMQPGEDGA